MPFRSGGGPASLSAKQGGAPPAAAGATIYFSFGGRLRTDQPKRPSARPSA